MRKTADLWNHLVLRHGEKRGVGHEPVHGNQWTSNGFAREAFSNIGRFGTFLKHGKGKVDIQRSHHGYEALLCRPLTIEHLKLQKRIVCLCFLICNALERFDTLTCALDRTWPGSDRACAMRRLPPWQRCTRTVRMEKWASFCKKIQMGSFSCVAVILPLGMFYLGAINHYWNHLLGIWCEKLCIVQMVHSEKNGAQLHSTNTKRVFQEQTRVLVLSRCAAFILNW